jgi:hypothetical protein
MLLHALSRAPAPSCPRPRSQTAMQAACPEQIAFSLYLPRVEMMLQVTRQRLSVAPGHFMFDQQADALFEGQVVQVKRALLREGARRCCVSPSSIGSAVALAVTALRVNAL